MANDMIETALASALEELERVKKIEEQQKDLLHKVIEKMDGMEKRLTEQKPVPVQPLSTAPLEAVITKGITRLQQTIEAQPKTVVRERRILLFPEYGAQEYYKTVVARLFVAVLAVIVTSFLFLLCKQFIEDWYAVHSQQKELIEYKNAWQQLYLREEKKKKKLANLPDSSKNKR